MSVANQYNGVAGNESLASAVNIASSTNATPIVVTTSAAHGLTSGDVVRIVGHATNTAANGVWSVTVLSTTTFSIATTGNGVGGATGTSQSQNILPTQPILVDGVDPLNATTIHTPVQGTLDRTSYIAQRIVRAYRIGEDLGALSGSSYRAGHLPSDIWSNRTAPNGSWAVNADLDGAGVFGSSYLDVLPGDILQAEFVTTADVVDAAGSSGIIFRLSYELVEYGASKTSTGTQIGGASVFVPQTWIGPMTIRGQIAPTISHGKKLYLYLEQWGNGASAKFELVGDYQYTARVMRAN